MSNLQPGQSNTIDLEALYSTWLTQGVDAETARAHAMDAAFGLLHEACHSFLIKLSAFSDDLMMGETQFRSLVSVSVGEASERLKIRLVPLSQWVEKSFRSLYPSNRTFFAVGEIRAAFLDISRKSQSVLYQMGK
jgi:hypothetical protein